MITLTMFRKNKSYLGTTTRRFKTLKGARNTALFWLGAEYHIDPDGYAVNTAGQCVSVSGQHAPDIKALLNGA